MDKKTYFTPKMDIIDLKHQACLLDSSSDCEEDSFCGELGLNIQESTDHKA